MSFRIILLLGFLVACTDTGLAQYSSATISSDRPGQAISPLSVGKYVFQAQAGMDAGGYRYKAIGDNGRTLSPNAVLRFGLTSSFEINGGWEYRFEKLSIVDSTFSQSGLSMNTLGFRFNIRESDGPWPAVGLQGSIGLPALSAAYNFKYAAPRLVLTASEGISKSFSLLTNLGIFYDGNTGMPSGLYVVNLGYTISDKLAAFIEGYGTFQRGHWEIKWDAGLGYLLHNDLQLDIYGGYGDNYGIADHFISIGVSYRTLTFRNEQNDTDK